MCSKLCDFVVALKCGIRGCLHAEKDPKGKRVEGWSSSSDLWGGGLFIVILKTHTH